MRSFSQFDIRPQLQSLEGDKIKLDRILNKEIIVEKFKIENSKFEKGNGKCLYMQITFDGAKRVLFSGSINLMDMIQRVPEDGFPFKTTITKENDRLQFT